MKQIFWVILLCLVYTNTFAVSKPIPDRTNCPKSETVFLSHLNGNIDLSSHLSYITFSNYTDDVNLILDGLTSPEVFTTDGVIPNFGSTYLQYWFCFSIHNDTEEPKPIVSFIKYPLLDEVIFYHISKNSLVQSEKQGRLYSYQTREHMFRGFSFSSEIKPKETATILLGINTASSMSVPVQIAFEKDFFSYVILDTITQGIYFGIVIVMALYNLFVYFLVKDKAYLFYVLYLLFGAILFQLSLQGMIPVLFLPNSGNLIWNGHNFLYFLFLFTCFPMSISFMNLKENSKTAYHIFFYSMFIPLISIILLILIDYRTMNRFGDSLSMALAVAALFVSFYVAFIKKFRPARFYFYGYFMVIVGGIATVLKYMGLVPVNVFTENGFQVGMAFEVLLMAFGLGDRISLIRKEKENIQIRAEINKQKLIVYQKELVLAQKLQESTLPQSLPNIPGLKIKAGYIPQSLVGGDFYDVTEISNKQIVCLIADVTGHGVPAAIEAAMLKIAHTHTLPFANGPGTVLETINRSLVGNYKNQLLTAAATYINLESMQMKVANAGHPGFYKFREDCLDIQIIRPKGKLIGFSKDVSYEEETCTLQPKDRILLFTDGLWDIWEKDKNGNQFAKDGSGEEVFLEWLKNKKNNSFEILFDKIHNHIRRRNQTSPAEDDITFLLLEIG
ncbi:7TM diverse intracellular signaling domain-containing protein [Leptospira sp. 96542]|nr:7TM diverse intracellular signaling domain-containing protein [Leptospira sp. 96542]